MNANEIALALSEIFPKCYVSSYENCVEISISYNCDASNTKSISGSEKDAIYELVSHSDSMSISVSNSGTTTVRFVILDCEFVDVEIVIPPSQKQNRIIDFDAAERVIANADISPSDDTVIDMIMDLTSDIENEISNVFSWRALKSITKSIFDSVGPCVEYDAEYDGVAQFIISTEDYEQYVMISKSGLESVKEAICICDYVDVECYRYDDITTLSVSFIID